MNRSYKANYSKKILLVTRNREICFLTRFILQDKLFYLNVNSAPDAKALLKDSTATSVLILDWSLQDKYNSIYKCLIKAKARKNILVVNILNSNFKKKWLLEKVPKLKDNKNIYMITNDFLWLSLLFVLVKIRMNLPSSGK